MIFFPYYSYEVITAHSGAEIARGLLEGYERARGVTREIYGGEINDKGFRINSVGREENIKPVSPSEILVSCACRYINITGTIRKNSPDSNTNTVRIIINANMMTYIAMVFIPVLLILRLSIRIGVGMIYPPSPLSEHYTSFYLVFFLSACFFTGLWIVFTFTFNKQVEDFRRYFDCILESIEHTNESKENELLRVLRK